MLHEIEHFVNEGHFHYYELRDKSGKIVLNGKRSTKVHPNRCVEWFSFFKNHILTRLPVGDYIVRAYTDHNKKNWQDYKIEKRKNDVFEEAQIIEPPVIVRQSKQQNTFPAMSLEEYTKLCKTIAQLEADKSVLEAENARLKTQNAELLEELEEASESDGLEDAPAEDVITKISRGLESAKPIFQGIADMFQQWKEIESRKIALAENGKMPQPRGRLKPAPKKEPQPQQTPPPPSNIPSIQEITAYFARLQDNHPEQFDIEMDQLAEQEPAIYTQVMANLGLEDETEENA